MATKYFSNIPKIEFEGKDSKTPLAFKYYDAKQVVGGKTMEEHLRFSMAYWHTMVADGSDPFGKPTMQRPWDAITNLVEKAEARAHAMFDFVEKLSIPFFCFHDRDIAPEMENIKETNKVLDKIVNILKMRMASSPVKLLWGTANLFSHPRYLHGAATSPDPKVYAQAAAQVKKAVEVTKELRGENYVFWGGREGYETLINTDMGLELDNLARFLHMAKDYAKEIGFDGQFLIEPKPKEPTKHQYDYDVASVIGFLYKYGLDKDVKINIETNHATLAGHTMQHELYLARINGLLGSVDANQGDPLLGWDTDQFPTDLYVSIFAMYEILKNGGLGAGGLNFDSKVRRASFEVEDLFHGHIVGMDSFARGLLVAEKLLKDKVLEDVLDKRYIGYQSGIGEKIVRGKTSLKELAISAEGNEDFIPPSGRQEMLEGIINNYL